MRQGGVSTTVRLGQRQASMEDGGWQWWPCLATVEVRAVVSGVVEDGGPRGLGLLRAAQAAVLLAELVESHLMMMTP